MISIASTKSYKNQRQCAVEWLMRGKDGSVGLSDIALRFTYSICLSVCVYLSHTYLLLKTGMPESVPPYSPGYRVALVWNEM